MDINAKLKSTMIVDILEWGYAAAFPPGYFDVVFACPPCETFSSAHTTKPRDLASAEDVVFRTLKIIKYLKPPIWFMENPRGGLMKSLPSMVEVPFVDVEFCQFTDWTGPWGYQKPTRV